MSDLNPVAFDIETNDLYPTTGQVTCYGLAHTLGVTMALNTGGRPAPRDDLVGIVEQHAHVIDLTVCESEAELLDALADDADRLDGDQHYLTGYNAETWRGGFDLGFLRTKLAFEDRDWPFDDMAFADTMEATERFETEDQDDLEGVYDVLVDEPHCDPFDESTEAIDAWEHAEWGPLLLHNLADIQRTLELIQLAEEYVPSSDFSMKNLAPPG